MEPDEREDIFLIEARKIAEIINNRDVPLISNFKLWHKDGDYFMTQIDNNIPDAMLLYTGEGWRKDDEDRVDAEWVIENLDLPE